MSDLGEWGQLLQGIGAVALAAATGLVGVVAAKGGIQVTFRNKLVLQGGHLVKRTRKRAFDRVESDVDPPGLH